MGTTEKDSMSVPFFQIDAFTAQAFAGNPAAVVILEAARDPQWMQRVAAEMNLSETAFLLPASGATEGARWGLRWFTPTVEVRLCGHATLAAAHALWTSGRAKGAEIVFDSLSGPLSARQRAGSIELDFPSRPALQASPPEGLIQALGAMPRFVGRNAENDWLVELDDEATVRGVVPDIALLSRLDARGVIITAPGESSDYDFVSRFFGPAAGVAEDPVTGSAHCCLAPFWAKRLGRRELTGYQASERGGTVGVEVVADRVRLRGEAVTVVRGELLV